MMKKIAIVKLSAMGDIIHSMIVLQFIKAKYQNITIDWFVESAFSGILKNNLDIHNIVELNLKSIKKSKKEIFSQLKLLKPYKNSYDLVIDAQGLIKSSLVARYLGKNVAGFCKNSTRESLASFFYSKKISISYEENVIDRNCYLFSKALNIDITKDDILNKKPFLFFNSYQNLDSYFSSSKKNIIFVVGASWKSKIYSKEKFAKIASLLDENFLIVWGNEEEKELASYIQDNSKAKMLPKITLDELKYIISKADLLIGNDTGPSHIAWALNVASITIFGNTPAYRNSYETAINKTVKSNSKVNPLKLNKNDFSINTIDENSIVDIAKGLLYV